MTKREVLAITGLGIGSVVAGVALLGYGAIALIVAGVLLIAGSFTIDVKE